MGKIIPKIGDLVDTGGCTGRIVEIGPIIRVDGVYFDYIDEDTPEGCPWTNFYEASILNNAKEITYPFDKATRWDAVGMKRWGLGSEQDFLYVV